MKIFSLWHYAAASFGILSFLLRRFFEKNPGTAERFYSQIVYPKISQWLTLPGRWLPSASASELAIFGMVSLSMIFVIHAAVTAVRFRHLFLRSLTRSFCHAAAAGCLIFGLYLWFWGYQYLRQPFSSSMQLTVPESPPAEDIEKFTSDMIAAVNQLSKNSKAPFSLKNIDQAVCNAVISTISKYTTTSRLPVCTPAKTLFANEILNVFGISGIFLPIFLEPHINSTITDWEIPFVMAHEKAHGMGFASETDANIIASISCLTAESETLRYSGALKLLISLRSYMASDDWMNRIYYRLSDTTQKDISEMNRRIWENYEKYQKTITVSRQVNDAYLKLNDQKLGIRSYGAALPVIIIWWNTQWHLTLKNNHEIHKDKVKAE